TVAFEDESQAVGGCANGDIRRWKIEGGRQQGPTMQAAGLVYSIAVSQDGRWIMSGDDGKKAIVWNALTHEKVLHTEYEGLVMVVDISSDCTKFVTGGWSSNTVRIFDITSGIRLLPPFSLNHFRGVKFSPDGSRFATASYYDGVRIYST
ncbi:hypothetical protein PISMIDRAFT_81461, partial [Pisolithus microcarpus 441]